uniref:Uncharacterized protein n=1 Tax=Clostridioides difficile TaxID=1496 RepID=A0A381I5N7_CLODI|nr:Uncharacterised protein [Clostridioides difficile]
MDNLIRILILAVIGGFIGLCYECSCYKTDI